MNEFIDEFMKGRISWGEGPQVDWDNNVKPEIEKLTALYALIDHGACGLIEPAWRGDYPENITRGLVNILGEILSALESFGKMLPGKVEALVRKNLEKAAIEADADLNPEKYADPDLIKYYKERIGTMLSHLDPVSKKEVVADLEGGAA